MEIDRPARPARSEFGRHWALDPDVVFLNHGSFGACPTAVLDEQTRLRNLFEADPMHFFLKSGPELWREARQAISTFLNAEPAGMTFQVNATAGVNTVLRGLDFRPGDEIIVHDHAYQACRNAVDFVCRRSGARPVIVPLPFPIDSPEQVLERTLAAVTPRSRLAMIDTVTSPTAIRLPFEALTKELQARGVEMLIDGAHGIGLLPLDLDALGAEYFVGNCHKWLCTPKGSGFLHIREDRRGAIPPLVISHGYSANLDGEAQFREEFDWQGTMDITPWLCIPSAISVIGSMVEGGWPSIMARNRALALQARDILCESLGVEAPAPDEMITAMATLGLPADPDESFAAGVSTHPLMDRLFETHRIETVIFPWIHHRALYLRLSAALYNSAGEFEYLALALSRV